MDKYKIGYTFDNTGRYAGVEKVYLEKRTGEYPHALNVVFDKPPVCREHEQAYWNNGWNKKTDRGYIEDKGKIREMTHQEKVDCGLEAEKKENEGNLILDNLNEMFRKGEITTEQYNKQIDQYREFRYSEETDKMAFLYLRGECTKEEWVAAMDKIRAELPKK